jgi:uncharacterized protein DUF5670
MQVIANRPMPVGPARPGGSYRSGSGRVAHAARPGHLENDHMLWTIIAILLVLWLLGLIGGIGGGLIHILLIIAAIVLVLQLVSGRNTTV